MNKNIYTISFFAIFIAVFGVVYKNLKVKGFRRFLVSFKLAVIITFSSFSPAGANENRFLPVPDALTNTPPISRPLKRHSGLFGNGGGSGSSNPGNGPNSGDYCPKVPEGRTPPRTLEYPNYYQQKKEKKELYDFGLKDILFPDSQLEKKFKHSGKFDPNLKDAKCKM